MIAYSVETNLAGFNTALRDYIALSRKTPLEAVQRQSGKLGFALSARLRLLAPARGSVRSGQLAAIEGGRGVKVRPSVVAAINKKFEGKSSVMRKGKRLNLQALRVQRELNLREQGIGYSGVVARFAGVEKLPPGKRDWLGRYQQVVSQAGLEARESKFGSNATMELSWSDSDLARPGEALATPQAQQALAGALAEVQADMQVYIERKQQEAAAKL